ncbi:FAD binding domain-containing protein [Paenibacillus oryzisoli]|uniref:FAD binding domain-containing protein n=1 Tax=Paenibacillus oryzisoli TaxID=1850517 RepID=UPI003D2961BE
MSIPMQRLPEQQPSVWQPASVKEAIQLQKQWGDAAVVVAGGTWLRPRWENGVAAIPQHLISLGRISALKSLSIDERRVVWNDGQRERTAPLYIRYGPLLSLNAVMTSELTHEHAPLLMQACAEVAAPSIRNMATIGGNVMTRMGDLIPALLVLEAQVVLNDGGQERELPLQTWLAATGDPSDIMTGILLPLQATKGHCQFYLKAGRREAFTPSVVTVAGRLTFQPDGMIASARLAAGGGSAIPGRLTQAEALLTGQPLSKALLKKLHSAAYEQCAAVPDDYVGIAYRKTTAANLIVSECYKAWRGSKGGGADAPES